jgi:lipopolysaccharide heptosyltransferase I
VAEPDPATGTPERILLVRLSALGDVVQSLPALAALRAARPTAEIGWLVEDRNAAVLRGHPDVDRLFVFRRGRIRSGEQSALGVGAALRRELRAWSPDTAVDLQGNLKSAMLTRLSGARRRIGLPPGEAREKAHWFATELVAPGAAREHRADRALRLVAPLGASPDAQGRLPPVSEEDRTAVDAGLESLGLRAAEYVVLVPGTSDFGAFKRWPVARFGDLARHLAGNGLAVLVAYGPGQKELADGVVKAAAGAARLAPETATLPQLVELMARSRLVVGADSGPVLLASFAGTPTVALFGPKDPGIYAPRGARTRTVRKGVYCSPCSLRRCGDPICMTTLWTGEVADVADELLRETA